MWAWNSCCNRWRYASRTATRNHEWWEAARKSASEMLPNIICAIICGPSKTNILIRLLESPNSTFPEHVRLLVAIAKVSISRQFVYTICLLTKLATFHSPTTTTSFHQAKRVQILFLSLMTYNKQDAMREYFSMDRHANVDCFSVRHKRGYLNIWYATTRTC